MQIDILKPKAGKLLKDLEALKLISIRKPADDGFITLVKKLRAKANSSRPPWMRSQKK